MLKFGGTSLEDERGFERVAKIVRAHERWQPVVVVSAMSRVTNALLSCLKTAAGGDDQAAARVLEEHFGRHLRVADNLGATARACVHLMIEDARREISELLKSACLRRQAHARWQDLIASHGERLCAGLLTAVLCEHGLAASYVDARRCILTDEEYGRATPLKEETEKRTRAELAPLLADSSIPVLGGFIAATVSGATTTMGRGSSDYTATLVGAALHAREAQIWSDVDGVMTADPRLVKTARTVERLSYEEAAELARFGAKVLHPKTIQPAIEKGIPVRIRNSRVPEGAGTLVSAQAEASPRVVKAIAHRMGLTVAEVTSTPEHLANGFMSAISDLCARHSTLVDTWTTSERGVSLSFGDGGVPPLILRGLKGVGEVEVKRGRAVVCLISDRSRDAQPLAARVGHIIKNICPEFNPHATQGRGLAFFVDDEFAGEVVTRLHHAFVERDERE